MGVRLALDTLGDRASCGKGESSDLPSGQVKLAWEEERCHLASASAVEPRLAVGCGAPRRPIHSSLLASRPTPVNRSEIRSMALWRQVRQVSLPNSDSPISVSGRDCL